MNDSLATIHLSALLVTALVSVFVPLVVGVLTRAKTPPVFKGVLMIVLNAVNAAVTTATLADGTAVLSRQSLLSLVVGVVHSVALYLSIWKPLGATSSRVVVVNEGQPVTVVPGKLANVGVK